MYASVNVCILCLTMRSRPKVGIICVFYIFRRSVQLATGSSAASVGFLGQRDVRGL